MTLNSTAPQPAPARAAPRPPIAAVLLALVMLAGAAFAPQGAVAAEDDGDAAPDAWMKTLWAPFQSLLDAHLEEKTTERGGLVSAFDYRAALDDERTADWLETQSRRLAEFDRDRLDQRGIAVAFWLNAYNYFMIEYILQNPHRGELIESVRDYGHLFNPYRVFGREVFDVGGRKYSLSEIENDVLLGDAFRDKGWKEARVHFAVNCASVGCPPLRTQVYLPGNVDELMTENTRRALNTDRHLHRDGDTLRVSSLFDWYASDYVEEAGSVEAFILAYADEEVREKVENTRRMRFIDYDWTLNSPGNFPEFSSR